RKQNVSHVFAEFLGAGVGIIVGAIPFDRLIFSDDFVAALPGYCDGADFAETPQAMIMLGVTSERQHFQGTAQVYIETALFRFAVQRRRAMNDRIRRMQQAIVFVAPQAETGSSQIATE